jgi:Family of unknown function (DUF6194)
MREDSRTSQEGHQIMNEIEMSRYISDTFSGVDVVVVSGNSFYFYNPDPNVPPDHMFPWVTLMTNDLNDQFSNLDRPSIYRLNIGVSKATFRTLFDMPERSSDSEEEREESASTSSYDLTALNQVMPHPVYGRMYWVCVLNPSDDSLQTTIRPLMNEAYAMAVQKYNKRS